MGKAIGDSPPMAVGIALSPVPITAVVLMLTTERAKVNGPVFVLGWLAGLGVVGAIVLAIAGPAGASSSGVPATWVSWLEIVLGALLLVVAVRQFRGRPRGEEQAPLPTWMGAVDKLKPPAALGAAGGGEPKEPAGGGRGGGHRADRHRRRAAGAQVPGLRGHRHDRGRHPGDHLLRHGHAARRHPLGRLKDWMAQHNAVIMSVLCLIIGAKVISDAISALT